jgi:uncharacterized protein YqgC (DUF456 family)
VIILVETMTHCALLVAHAWGASRDGNCKQHLFGVIVGTMTGCVKLVPHVLGASIDCVLLVALVSGASIAGSTCLGC